MRNLEFLEGTVTVLGGVSLLHLHSQSAWNTKILHLGFTSYKNCCVFSKAQLFEEDLQPGRSVIWYERPVLCWVVREQHQLGNGDHCSEEYIFFLSFFFFLFYFFLFLSPFSIHLSPFPVLLSPFPILLSPPFFFFLFVFVVFSLSPFLFFFFFLLFIYRWWVKS